jgi:hypothetical protein
MTQVRTAGVLLDDETLSRSPVVANCAMNRERQLAGVNSYARELRFSPLDVIVAQLACTSDGSGRRHGSTCAAGRAGRSYRRPDMSSRPDSRAGRGQPAAPPGPLRATQLATSSRRMAVASSSGN